MRKETLYTNGEIRTSSGIYVKVFDPNPDTLQIEDIAFSLSNQCRWSGHIKFFSVGQHSILTSLLVGEKYKLSALMHDASEAYLVDVPSPIKADLTNYKIIEDRLMRVLAEKFKFIYPLPSCVKMADTALLKAEWKQLMLARQNHITIKNITHNAKQPGRSMIPFLTAFKRYGGTINE